MLIEQLRGGPVIPYRAIPLPGQYPGSIWDGPPYPQFPWTTLPSDHPVFGPEAPSWLGRPRPGLSVPIVFPPGPRPLPLPVEGPFLPGLSPASGILSALKWSVFWSLLIPVPGEEIGIVQVDDIPAPDFASSINWQIAVEQWIAAARAAGASGPEKDALKKEWERLFGRRVSNNDYRFLMGHPVLYPPAPPGRHLPPAWGGNIEWPELLTDDIPYVHLFSRNPPLSHARTVPRSPNYPRQVVAPWLRPNDFHVLPWLLAVLLKRPLINIQGVLETVALGFLAPGVVQGVGLLPEDLPLELEAAPAIPPGYGLPLAVDYWTNPWPATRFELWLWVNLFMLPPSAAERDAWPYRDYKPPTFYDVLDHYW